MMLLIFTLWFVRNVLFVNIFSFYIKTQNPILMYKWDGMFTALLMYKWYVKFHSYTYV